MMDNRQHPVQIAKDYGEAFAKSGSLSEIMRPVRWALIALIHLHAKAMPWKVRLSVLFTGKIPLSYLEEFNDDRR